MNNKNLSKKLCKDIILASASPRRRELLSQAGIHFTVIAGSGEERTESGTPCEAAEELSGKKAREIWNRLSGEEQERALVIGADTVVSLEGNRMGKPKDEEEAVRMLTALQGRSHQVYTGVTLVWQEEGKEREYSFFEETRVFVYAMSDAEIRSYVATGEPMDKAGAYGIQGRFAAYVKGIDGDYNNVVGLPLGRLCQELRSRKML